MLRRLMPFLMLLLLSPMVLAQGMKSTATPSEPHGMVISSVDNPGNSIFAVNIKNIDGGEIPPFPSGVWLKPGEHQIKGFGLVDNAWTQGRVRGGFDRYRRKFEPITIDVEEGMAYYIGLKTVGHPSEWKLVVWRTEPLNNYDVATR